MVDGCAGGELLSIVNITKGVPMVIVSWNMNGLRSYQKLTDVQGSDHCPVLLEIEVSYEWRI